MPNAAPRACNHAGCHSITTDRSGRCEEHRTAVRRQYDTQRGSSTARGYGYKWQQYRAWYIREHPVCCDPDKRHVGRTELAEHVDHVIAVSGPNDPLFWDEPNHQALCHGCHSAKTVTHDGGFGRTRASHVE